MAYHTGILFITRLIFCLVKQKSKQLIMSLIKFTAFFTIAICQIYLPRLDKNTSFSKSTLFSIISHCVSLIALTWVTRTCRLQDSLTKGLLSPLDNNTKKGRYEGWEKIFCWKKIRWSRIINIIVSQITHTIMTNDA